MKKYIVLSVLLYVTACASFAPFVDTYSGVGNKEVRRSTPNHVAICFNHKNSDEKSLQQLADEECAKTNRRAVYKSTVDWSCSLTAPSTIYFDCK